MVQESQAASYIKGDALVEADHFLGFPRLDTSLPPGELVRVITLQGAEQVASLQIFGDEHELAGLQCIQAQSAWAMWRLSCLRMVP